MKQLFIQETAAPSTFVVTAGGALALYTGSKECCEAVKRTLERYAAWVVGEPDVRGEPRMEQFEQQVAEALSCAEDFVDGTGAVWVKRDEIAPRVAAAIEAAVAWPVIWDVTDGDMMDAANAALAALRGEK